MTNIDWTQVKDPAGNNTLEFRITREGKRDITGALWFPYDPSTCKTLMCFGHGASGDRYQAPIVHLASRFGREENVAVLSLDGPVHGLRKVGGGGREETIQEFMKPDTIDNMVEDWTIAVDAVKAREEFSIEQLGYFGLSMGSAYGVPFAASRDDMTCALFGIFGTSGFPEELPLRKAFDEAVAKITFPLRYFLQLEDELFSREACLAAFDGFASTDKGIFANPGLHPEIPSDTINHAYDFLSATLRGETIRKVGNIIGD